MGAGTGSIEKYTTPVEGTEAPSAASPSLPSPPRGFEPGVKFSGRTGTICTRPQDNTNPNWDEMLREWGFDPTLYKVVGNVEVATWDFGAKEKDAEGVESIKVRQMWSYRAKIVALSELDEFETASHYEKLVNEVRAARKKNKPVQGRTDASPSSLVVGLADWQMGKDDGYGVEGTIHQIENMIEQIPVRIKELRKSGRRIDSMYVFGLGDLTEGCGGHYDQQTFRVKLDRRDQVKVVRRCLRDAFMYWATECGVESIIGSAVGGNHGENRSGVGGGGKSFTTFNDNDDVAVFESVAEILSNNPNYDHVHFALPSDRLSMAFDVSGQVIAITHGHATKSRSGEPSKVMWDWWAGQALGKTNPAANADILLSGHYHSLNVKQQKNRTLIIAPTIDGGSVWFEQTTGMASEPGTVSFVCSPDGWSDLHIISSKKVQ